MKLFWMSASLIFAVEVCFGIPNDGLYHKHMPSLLIITEHAVAKYSGLEKFLCSEQDDNKRISALSKNATLSRLSYAEKEHFSYLEADRLDSIEKTAYDILCRKKEPDRFYPNELYSDKLYVDACCRGTDASRISALSLIGHGVGGGSNRASALEWAASSGHEKALLVLLNQEQEVVPAAVIQAKDNVLLRMAALHGLTKAVEVLLNYPTADKLAVHAEQDASLRNAASRGCFDIVRMLVSCHADIHAKDEEALRNAVNNGHVEVVDYLLQHGAHAAVLDNVALKFVTEQFVRNDVENSEIAAYAKIAELLRQYGARVTQEAVII